MPTLCEGATYIFDPLHHAWEHPRTHHLVGGSLVVVFVLGLIAIELNRAGFLPPELAAVTPTSHFMAISMAFTFVLIQEVIDLVFALPCSVSRAVGKQLEILSLILLRNSFKELAAFDGPVHLAGNLEPILHIIADGAGALVIFVLLALYQRIQKHKPTIKDPGKKYTFVATKKAISLMLLLIFAASGIFDIWLALSDTGHPYDFFETFYTVLIFSDILIVLISQQHLPTFHAVFRNSGYALATLIMRLALTAPPYYNAALGIAAALFAVGLTLAHNYFLNGLNGKDPY